MYGICHYVLDYLRPFDIRITVLDLYHQIHAIILKFSSHWQDIHAAIDGLETESTIIFRQIFLYFPLRTRQNIWQLSCNKGSSHIFAVIKNVQCLWVFLTTNQPPENVVYDMRKCYCQFKKKPV